MNSLYRPSSSISKTYDSRVLFVLGVPGILSTLVNERSFLYVIYEAIVSRRGFRQGSLFVSKFRDLSGVFFSIMGQRSRECRQFVRYRSSILFSSAPTFFPRSFGTFAYLSSAPSSASF